MWYHTNDDWAYIYTADWKDKLITEKPNGWKRQKGEPFWKRMNRKEVYEAREWGIQNSKYRPLCCLHERHNKLNMYVLGHHIYFSFTPDNHDFHCVQEPHEDNYLHGMRSYMFCVGENRFKLVVSLTERRKDNSLRKKIRRNQDNFIYPCTYKVLDVPYWVGEHGCIGHRMYDVYCDYCKTINAPPTDLSRFSKALHQDEFLSIW